MQIPAIARGKRHQLPRPPGSADALALAQHARTRKAAGQLLCVVCADAADAQRLLDELPIFAPELRLALFPDWETLPYDGFSPHQDLISERLATLWRVRGRDLDVVLLPATTALARLAPPGFLAGYTFHFRQKMRLDEAALKGQLTLAGYQHVSQVVSPGEYAVRGGLIDLFPMGSPVPYRVDLFGDEVDFTKGLFHRVTDRGDPRQYDGGRVTELVARPLINLVCADLARYYQPLGGQVGIRTELLASLPVVTAFGVEIGMLFDVSRRVGHDRIGEVELGDLVNSEKGDGELLPMAQQVAYTLLTRAGCGEPGWVPAVRPTFDGDLRVVPGSDVVERPPWIERPGRG